MASEPPSPSGHGPLPLAVVETPSLPTTGTVHFTMLLLCVGIGILRTILFFFNGEPVNRQCTSVIHGIIEIPSPGKAGGVAEVLNVGNGLTFP